MKSYEIEEYLTPLLHKHISFQGNPKGKLLRWTLNDKLLKLTTEETDVVILNQDLDDLLQKIKSLDMELRAPINLETSIIRQSGIELKNILLNNIRKVQDDSTYLPQAQEVNANVKTIIDLAKTEVEMAKTIAILNKNVV